MSHRGGRGGGRGGQGQGQWQSSTPRHAGGKHAQEESGGVPAAQQGDSKRARLPSRFPSHAHAPTVRDLITDTLAPLANQYWAPGAPSHAPYDPRIIEVVYAEHLAPVNSRATERAKRAQERKEAQQVEEGEVESEEKEQEEEADAAEEAEQMQLEQQRAQRLLLLELSAYLENYLWKYYDPATSTFAHVMSFVMLVNQKFKGENRVGIWDPFQDRPADLVSLLDRISRLKTERDLSMLEANQLLIFFIHAFESFEEPSVRKVFMRLASVDCWRALRDTSILRVLRCSQAEAAGGASSAAESSSGSGDLRAVWKRVSAKPANDFSAAFLPNLLSEFVHILYSLDDSSRIFRLDKQASGSGSSGSNQLVSGSDRSRRLPYGVRDLLVYLERFLEFLIGLLGKLSTRRWAKKLVEDVHLLVLCLESPLVKRTRAKEQEIMAQQAAVAARGAKGSGSDAMDMEALKAATVSGTASGAILSMDNYSNTNASISASALPGRLFCQLLDILSRFLHFEVDDATGKPLPAQEVLHRHYLDVAIFQKVCFKFFSDVPQLLNVALANVSRIEDREKLAEMLQGVDEGQMRQLCVKMQLLPREEEVEEYTKQSKAAQGKKKGSASPSAVPRLIVPLLPYMRSRSFLLHTLQSYLTRRPSTLASISAMPLYPSESLLFDEHAIPSINYTGDTCLALPKLNLQFLTVHDYLTRNFELYKGESTYEIREDIAYTLKRLKARVGGDGSTLFTGWARMACPLLSFAVTGVLKPRIGDTKPSAVRAEITVDLSVFQGIVREEWEALRMHDVLFLISVQALTPMQSNAGNAMLQAGGGRTASNEDRGRRRADVEGMDLEGGLAPEESFRSLQSEPLLVRFVRGAEVRAVLDGHKRIIGERDEKGNVYKARGSIRTFRVELDAAQYGLDQAAEVAGGPIAGGGSPVSEVYSSFNLVLRRKPKENNFKGVLETIRDLMTDTQSGVSFLPPWLEQVFLGYGNPLDSQYYSPVAKRQEEVLEFTDTFLDLQHLRDSFHEAVKIEERLAGELQEEMAQGDKKADLGLVALGGEANNRQTAASTSIQLTRQVMRLVAQAQKEKAAAAVAASGGADASAAAAAAVDLAPDATFRVKFPLGVAPNYEVLQQLLYARGGAAASSSTSTAAVKADFVLAEGEQTLAAEEEAMQEAEAEEEDDEAEEEEKKDGKGKKRAKGKKGKKAGKGKGKGKDESADAEAEGEEEAASEAEEGEVPMDDAADEPADEDDESAPVAPDLPALSPPPAFTQTAPVFDMVEPKKPDADAAVTPAAAAAADGDVESEIAGLKSLTVAKLKDRLKDVELKTDGLKADLIERLGEHMREKAAESAAPAAAAAAAAASSPSSSYESELAAYTAAQTAHAQAFKEFNEAKAAHEVAVAAYESKRAAQEQARKDHAQALKEFEQRRKEKKATKSPSRTKKAKASSSSSKKKSPAKGKKKQEAEAEAEAETEAAEADADAEMADESTTKSKRGSHKKKGGKKPAAAAATPAAAPAAAAADAIPVIPPSPHTLHVELLPRIHARHDYVRRNQVRFTPIQVEAIKSGLNPGLTMIVGPPGTGKTDTAVQIISELYHNFPEQRTLLITHSNHALNDLFEKIMQRDIDERYLLRMGRGSEEVAGESDMGKFGRVNFMLQRRITLLEEVGSLARSMGMSDDVAYTCETSGHFFRQHILARWEKFVSVVQQAQQKGDAAAEELQAIVERHFPFAKYFQDKHAKIWGQYYQNSATIAVGANAEAVAAAAAAAAAAAGGDAMDTSSTDAGSASASSAVAAPAAQVAPSSLFRGASLAEDMSIAVSCFADLQKTFVELEETRPFELLRTYKDRSNYLLSKHAKIIAMTCTHAAIKRKDFVDLNFRFDNIVMEESAQILEIETFIPFLLQRADPDSGSRLQRIILLGDHQQLPPVVKNRAFQKFSHMDQSLFTRFIRLGMPFVQLNAQGRMRSSLAELWNWKYENLGNLPAVQLNPRYQTANPGFAHEYQLVNVEDLNGVGESSPTPFFYQNLAEAEYVVQTYMYMRLLGYPASSISILTTYNGQKHLIRDILAQRCANNLLFGLPAKVSTVDKFQGQQNDFILLSLVRTRTAGHLRDVRRLVVAMSRARLGLYIFARMHLFTNCFELTRTFNQLLRKPVKLQIVPQEKRPMDQPLYTPRLAAGASLPEGTPQELVDAAAAAASIQPLEVRDVVHMGELVGSMTLSVQSEYGEYARRMQAAAEEERMAREAREAALRQYEEAREASRREDARLEALAQRDAEHARESERLARELAVEQPEEGAAAAAADASPASDSDSDVEEL